MADKTFIVRADESVRLETEDFEHVIERLAALASAQNRGFLAYLLTMALIHLRDQSPDFPPRSH
jgi:hypothetical protein